MKEKNPNVTVITINVNKLNFPVKNNDCQTELKKMPLYSVYQRLSQNKKRLKVKVCKN